MENISMVPIERGEITPFQSDVYGELAQWENQKGATTIHGVAYRLRGTVLRALEQWEVSYVGERTKKARNLFSFVAFLFVIYSIFLCFNVFGSRAYAQLSIVFLWFVSLPFLFPLMWLSFGKKVATKGPIVSLVMFLSTAAFVWEVIIMINALAKIGLVVTLWVVPIIAFLYWLLLAVVNAKLTKVAFMVGGYDAYINGIIRDAINVTLLAYPDIQGLKETLLEVVWIGSAQGQEEF